ncbi:MULTISPECIES: threonine--tRNA ligase [unclassified Paenibacillus]|uniref:threonine--tRNA ligase n=1 Tax=unclassified Paenibacillus TaxID=185978 RepID=UPI0009559434|nr:MULTISPECIES: threonine--tRNA ligase [unclassified Paenibacillus]ASS66811.1 threonine--tRNA ligase [Paenibacillus sp. RUD330]SIP94662.1 threonyl-tRNA synthetase [Paenibacillus sp. RU4X]SIQ13094.1 threonyl-tRNA synthetase [Paenibacillus sp. RU4T]
MDIDIRLADGSARRYPQGTTGKDIAESIGAGLAKRAVAARIDGNLMDLGAPVQDGSLVEIVTLDSGDGLGVYRHSTAHILAQALKRLYGGDAVKLGIGPVIADGFYYDIDMERSLSSDDLASIEREMEAVIREDLPIVRKEIGREEALAFFRELREPYKVQLIQDLPEGVRITLYSQGEFTDLCRGPHLPSTGLVKAFKLQSVAGAYWRGDSAGPMLQRIYGTAFLKKLELEEHLHLLEEAKKRDHRKLGKELGLFMFSEEAPGMPFYLPNGMTIRTELEEFARDLQRKRDYDEVRTPLMMNKRLWEESGHWDHYKDNMYFAQVDEAEFALKPMNCPGHMLVFKNSLHSYRELPIRISEFGQVHRHEFSGALSGMTRVRTFCQDDAHLFVRPDQIENEIASIMELIDYVYTVFGFTYEIELSTRPEDSMGSEELWEEAERSLRQVLESRGVKYRLNEGDGAFYGPKIDYHIKDALKRSWQCGTIQLDFQMPEKFGLSYVGEDGGKHAPVVIHRAVYGSIDRFMGILTEHYEGAFPLWLAPVQVKLLPVSDKHLDYALRVQAQLREAGIRVECDVRTEKLGYKIREAQLQKIPYMLVLGEQEAASGSVSVRRRGEGDLGSMSMEELIRSIRAEIEVLRGGAAHAD